MRMIWTVLRNLVSRPATRMYPAEPVALPKGERGRVVYDMSKCIFCGLCEKRCPNDAIAMDKEHKRQSVSRAKCMACGVCVESCPVDAIEMRPEYSPPATAPEVHVYDAELTPHQFTVASLPPFQRDKARKPEPVEPPEEARGGKGEGADGRGAKGKEEAARAGLGSLAREVMTSPVLTLFEDDTVRKAVQTMVANSVEGLPVVDANLRVLGVITGTDIARDIGRGKEGILTFLFMRSERREDRDSEKVLQRTMDKPVGEIMSAPAVTATEDTPLGEIAATMDRHRFSRVPIVDASDRLSGIVTRDDLLRTIAKSVGQGGEEQRGS